MGERLNKLLGREFILAFIIEAVASVGFLMELSSETPVIGFTEWFAVSGMVLALFKALKPAPPA